MKTDNDSWEAVKTFLIGFVVIFLMMLISPRGIASDDSDECRQGHEQCGHNDDNDDIGDVTADATAEANSDASASAGASATVGVSTNATTSSTGIGEGGGGGDASIVYGKRAPNTFLYMQNQVESCGRTFGISGSNTSGGWALGIPIPRGWTPTCDLWKAAEEAQQNGHVYTSYMFMCSIKTVRKAWGRETCAEFEQRSLVELGLAGPISMIEISINEYESLLAQVTEEEFEERQQMIEDRFVKYDNLIQAQQQEITFQQEEAAADNEEIEQLKTEAVASQEREDRESARRAAARKALKKENDNGSEGDDE